MTTKIFAAFVAAMMTMTMSASNNVKNNNNASTPDNTLPNVVVIATAKQKTMEVVAANGRHMKYEYNLDDMGRVSTKVSYVKNIMDNWTPISAYSVFYGNEETVLTFAEYDMMKKTYSQNAKQVRYNAVEFPLIIRVPGE